MRQNCAREPCVGLSLVMVFVVVCGPILEIGTQSHHFLLPGPPLHRFEYMWRIGNQDLDQGLQLAAALFTSYTIARYDSIKNIHTILLIITFAIMACYTL